MVVLTVVGCVMIYIPRLEGDLSPRWCNSLLHLRAKFQSNQSRPVQGHAPVQVKCFAPAVLGGLHTATMLSVINTQQSLSAAAKAINSFTRAIHMSHHQHCSQYY